MAQTQKTDFNKQPVISIQKDGSCIVMEDIVVTHCGKKHTIQKGYRCDTASISPLLRGLVSKYNACNAGIVHDFMYSWGYYERAEADKIFYLLLRKTKMNIVSCFLAYAAVRIFGWIFYGKRQKKRY